LTPTGLRPGKEVGHILEQPQQANPLATDGQCRYHGAIQAETRVVPAEASQNIG
jgi:hypothetical protein